MSAKRFRAAGLLGSLVLSVAALVAACQSSTGAPVPLVVQTGRADSAEAAISITTPDWTYSVPSEGVTWIDAAGSRLDSGRPDCLAPDTSHPVRFAAVAVTLNGGTWRPVVWISCE